MEPGYLWYCFLPFLYNLPFLWFDTMMSLAPKSLMSTVMFDISDLLCCTMKFIGKLIRWSFYPLGIYIAWRLYRRFRGRIWYALKVLRWFLPFKRWFWFRGGAARDPEAEKSRIRGHNKMMDNGPRTSFPEAPFTLFNTEVSDKRSRHRHNRHDDRKHHANKAKPQKHVQVVDKSIKTRHALRSLLGKFAAPAGEKKQQALNATDIGPEDNVEYWVSDSPSDTDSSYSSYSGSTSETDRKSGAEGNGHQRKKPKANSPAPIGPRRGAGLRPGKLQLRSPDGILEWPSESLSFNESSSSPSVIEQPTGKTMMNRRYSQYSRYSRSKDDGSRPAMPERSRRKKHDSKHRRHRHHHHHHKSKDSRVILMPFPVSKDNESNGVYEEGHTGRSFFMYE